MKKIKKVEENIIKDIRNLFRLKNKNKAIKERAIRYIRNLFEHEEEENYYKPVRLGNFWGNNYIEYESNRDTNKTLLVGKYLNKIRPYLKGILLHRYLNNLETSMRE